MSRNLFYKRNQVRTRRVALASAMLLAALTAATVFLCVRPMVTPANASTAAPEASAGATTITLPLPSTIPSTIPTDLPASAPAVVDPRAGKSADAGSSAAMATMAMDAGKLVTLADRHASDALRIASEANGAHDDLGWDYVQLRL
ncbi:MULTISPECIES: hypothetical protein [Cupriavidus]|uniref:Uncharacterized protein n=1 Tax=Cupriavidus pauculus TaxID=82633 RepID=A0A5P2H5Q0_9BURK|nr:hypothetical protein [Cupriavidus pauculus]QET03038.1 hypothetical protein FOB72_13935 [Cupriavidus pauculus]